MYKDLEQLFARLQSPEPPAGLFGAIMERIGEEARLRSARKHLALFSIIAAVSAGAVISAFIAVRSEFMQSGIFQFFSLLYSDAALVAVNWKEFGFALLESFPAMHVIALLAVVLAFLWSLKQFSFAVRAIRHPHPLIR